MDAANWAAIIVAIVSVVSAALSGRAAQKAAQSSSHATISNARTQAETEAYNRARKMDIETIDRQDKELEELRIQVRNVKLDNERLHEDNDRLRRRVTALEQQLGVQNG